MHRVGACGIASVEPFVPVVMRDGNASYSGVINCESLWACPVCSASQRQQRAEVVERRAKMWLANGGGLVFLTLTMPHTIADDLPDLLDRAFGAWRDAQQRGTVRRALSDLGYCGPLRATEITHGYNGWHPHHHLLLFFSQPLSESQAEAVEGLWWRAWADAVESRGGKRPSAEHGAVLYRVGSSCRDAEAVGAYLVKMQDGLEPKNASWSAAKEMTRGDLKRGRSRHRTPFEIAEKAGMGDKKAAALWRVYERSTKGRRCMQWGQKLERVIKALEAASGELAIAGDSEVVTVLELADTEWALIRSYYAESRFLGELERGGVDGATNYLRLLHRRWSFDLARGRRPRAQTPLKLIA